MVLTECQMLRHRSITLQLNPDPRRPLMKKPPKPSVKRRRLPDREHTVLIPARFPLALHRKMRLTAFNLNWSTAELIREAVTNFLTTYHQARKGGGS